MPRRNRRSGGAENSEINLAPFMNMVIIIIPLLLLSVVFLEAGVINITAPKLSVGPPKKQEQQKKKKEPLNLTVAVSDSGFRIAATGAVLPPQSGCPKGGPTICLKEQSVDVKSRVEKARKAFQAGKAEQAKKHLSSASAAYNWKALYNKLVEIKKQYPDETIVNVSGDPDIPYSFIVRVMDVARYKLEKDSYEDSDAFWKADMKKSKSGESKFARLFSDPVLSVAK